MSARTMGQREPERALGELGARQYFAQVLEHLEKEGARRDRAVGYLLTPSDAPKLRALLEMSGND